MASLFEPQSSQMAHIREHGEEAAKRVPSKLRGAAFGQGRGVVNDMAGVAEVPDAAIEGNLLAVAQELRAASAAAAAREEARANELQEWERAAAAREEERAKERDEWERATKAREDAKFASTIGAACILLGTGVVWLLVGNLMQCDASPVGIIGAMLTMAKLILDWRNAVNK